MSEPLASETKELQALSRQKLQVAVGLLIGHTTLKDLILTRTHREAGLPTVRGRNKMIVYIYFIVWHLHAKGTELWVVCS
jgi:hypothetical protein